MSVVERECEPKAITSDVPANFYRGARFAWHQRRRHALVRRLMKGIEGKRVLDYGCGYGDLTYAISKTNSVVGIDVDHERIEFCRSQYPELEFQTFDGETAPFPDRTFDVVLSCVVLPFVADHNAHFRDVQRVLTKNGNLVLLSKNTPVVQNLIRKLLGRPAVTPHLNVCPADESRKQLERLSFAIESQGYFFDPPFTDWNSLNALVVGTVEQSLSIFRFGRAAGYWAIVARNANAELT